MDPKAVVIEKLASIVLVVNSVLPTIVNCPIFFISSGSVFPNTLGNNATKFE